MTADRQAGVMMPQAGHGDYERDHENEQTPLVIPLPGNVICAG